MNKRKIRWIVWNISYYAKEIIEDVLLAITLFIFTFVVVYGLFFMIVYAVKDLNL